MIPDLDVAPVSPVGGVSGRAPGMAGTSLFSQGRTSTNRRAMDSPSIPFGVAAFEFRVHMLPQTILAPLIIRLGQLFHRVEARRPEA